MQQQQPETAPGQDGREQDERDASGAGGGVSLIRVAPAQIIQLWSCRARFIAVITGDSE